MLPGSGPRRCSHPVTPESRVRALLPRTWFPFFSRFGRLTEVQIRTIPLLIEGRNLVVISPSASGKTEAVAAPVIERLLGEMNRQGRQGNRQPAAGNRRLAILYVSPTRALVNDLYRRLAEPLEYLGLGLARKTGDHPDIDEARLPFMLLTTPESFDSLLGRHTRIFAGLGAVVLDELHLLDNTPRGDQLRLLLERLRLVKADVQFCALSATVDDEDIGQRYFPDPVVVKVDARRSIERVLMPMGEDWHERAVAELRNRGCRKALCFFNSRSWAESSAGMLEIPPFRNRVWVHHASLNRKVREEVEARMNRESIGLLCCTSTLELGIDIGDIDAVVLVRPPFNVSSLLQRIGRGNRRRDTLLAIGFHTDGWERFLFETFFECCATGRLYEKRYTPALSVVPQQVVSYMFQRRRVGTTLAALRRLFAAVYRETGVLDSVFRHLSEQGVVVEQRPGIYFLSPKLESSVEYGRIHSNIQDKSFGKYEVYEASTNRHLGTVFFVFRTFMLGGRAWELVEFRQKEGRIMVRPFKEVGATTKVFEGTGTGGYGFRMAQVLKSRLFPGLAAMEFPCFKEGDQLFIVHLLGATYGFVLSEAFAREGVPAVDIDGKLLALPAAAGMPRAFPVPGTDAIREVVRRNIARLEDSLGSGAFFRLLPQELKVEDHLLALDIAGLLEFLGTVKPVEMRAEEVTKQMKAHMGANDQ